jgi:DNA-binding PadR family transcriptional regulator
VGHVGEQRRTKFYRLTRSGRARLGDETASWNRIADAVTMALRTTAKEI